MAKPMSDKSVSYSRVDSDYETQSFRFKKEVSYLPVRSFKEDKLTQMKYLKENTLMLQAVFRAEIVKILTKSEIQKHLENLQIALEEIEPGKVFKISCHPQSDATTKSSHFHIWGDITPVMEKEFEQYLINNKLTVQDRVNITSISKGQLKKVDLNEDGNEEFKKVTFENRTGHYIVGKNEIKSRNVTESTVIETIKIVEKNEDLIINEIDLLLEKEFKKTNEELERMMESAEFEEFERKYKHTMETLNQTLDNFMISFDEDIEKIERRVKELNSYSKDI